ncbi:MAG TPA: helix-turn-helix transcriptional regulator [Chloroflexota bacterium]|nr:helix-turn-helix transcriptional regulator [Chloroflexota bacterium]
MSECSPRAPFSDVLRKARESAGLTQAALARRAGLDTSYISRLERSESTTPRSETLSRLVYALGLSEEARSDFLAAAGLPHFAWSMPSPSADAPPPGSALGVQAREAPGGPRGQATGSDSVTRRRRLELRVRETEERLQAEEANLESLSLQLATISRELQSAVANQRYLSHDLQKILSELAGREPRS